MRLFNKISEAVRLLLVITFVVSLTVTADVPVSTIQDYDRLLPNWGTSWKPGAGAVNGYYPSFYTGFAPRNNDPQRIHVRTSRGNQTRVTVILDRDTVMNYLFDLVARYNFYRELTEQKRIQLSPSGASFLPHLAYFNKIIESPEYGILPFVERAERRDASDSEIYEKGLSVMSALNPKRVFPIQMDLRKEFSRWAELLRNLVGVQSDYLSYFSDHPNDAVVAINSLILGRINFIKQPNSDVLNALSIAARAAINNAPDFEVEAARFLKLVTGTKYDQTAVLADGTFTSAIQCSSTSNCWLILPEFTAIYPTGSAKSRSQDEFDNQISNFATPGLWPFVERSPREVDHIRKEPYYGWAPKMDFEAIGNGFHNPAVRHTGMSSALKDALGVAQGHTTYWAAVRGPISHGCLRLPLGHIWEMRHTFPVESEKMKLISQFGNSNQDFDLFDIDGDGTPEVMGVRYFIYYITKGEGDSSRREGDGLATQDKHRSSYYSKLYGSRGVFTEQADGQLVFHNPSISIQSYLDLQKKRVANHITVNGDFQMYEADYEQDKAQFYLPLTKGGRAWSGPDANSKLFIRLLGRVRGCAPKANKEACGEAAFVAERRQLLGF